MTIRRVFGIETIPGSPEPDTSRIYVNEARTAWVDVNYDESKAGVLGADYTLEDPLVFADGRKVATRAGANCSTSSNGRCTDGCRQSRRPCASLWSRSGNGRSSA